MNPPANRRSQSRVSAKSKASPASSKADAAPKATEEATVAETIEEVEASPKTSRPAQDTATSEEVGAIPEAAPQIPVAETSSEVEALPSASRQVPIPPPNHPRQYRAIGLVLGKFEPSDEKITQGVLQTADGAAIDTVLLGRMISLVKKRLDLAQPHLWVVYPRSRQEDDKLHLQISGIWEPETLHPQEKLESAAAKVEGGYFSIRGEVVFYSLEKEITIVKIRQSPKTEGERPKFFKIKLKGNLPDRPLRNFWDLQVQLQGETLTIVSGTNLGVASKPRKPFKKGDRKPWSKQPRRPSDSPVAPPTKPTTGSRPSFERPIKKREV
jgi:hypothetical protein